MACSWLEEFVDIPSQGGKHVENSARRTDRAEMFVSRVNTDQPPWRNRLARSAVNRKVGGSSPPGGA